VEEEIIVKFVVSEDVQSQQVQNSPVTNSVIVNPIHIMRSRWIPTTLSLGVTIVTSGIDFTKKQDIQITLVNRNSGRVIYDTGKTEINVPGANSDNFNFTLELKNLDFEDEGYYDINFTLNGEKHTDYFKVLKSDDDND